MNRPRISNLLTIPEHVHPAADARIATSRRAASGRFAALDPVALSIWPGEVADRGPVPAQISPAVAAWLRHALRHAELADR